MCICLLPESRWSNSGIGWINFSLIINQVFRKYLNHHLFKLLYSWILSQSYLNYCASLDPPIISLYFTMKCGHGYSKLLKVTQRITGTLPLTPFLKRLWQRALKGQMYLAAPVGCCTGPWSSQASGRGPELELLFFLYIIYNISIFFKRWHLFTFLFFKEHTAHHNIGQVFGS